MSNGKISKIIISREFGFRTYVREMIDAPEAILVYLCLYCNIHQVPIGSDYTQKNISSILPKVSEFGRVYTNTHQYSFSRSRYTNKISSSSIEVSDSYWLTSSIDQSKLDQFEQREREIKQRLKELEISMRQIQEEKQKLEKRLEAYRNEATKLRERRYHIETLGKKLNTKMNLYKSIESQKIILVTEAKKILEKIGEFSKGKSKLFQNQIQSVKNLVQLCKDKTISVYQDAQYQNEKLKLETDWRNYTNQKQEIESNLEKLKQAVNQAKEGAKNSLEAASKMNEINLEKGLPDSYKQKFAKLPDSLEKLEAELHQCEAIAQCSYDVDEKVVEDFENRKKVIQQLTKDFEKKKQKLDDHQSNYEQLKNDWLQKVEDMIKDINEKFSTLFMQLKCAGEVSLSRPDNSDEFAKYGICIRVSFRTGEQLQELTAWQQSGGEKSVSTMLYMIALQEMTRCPFRVVDEINQGMDPVNERKVFDIIVQNSCSKLSAQYFLLTPKLLPDLAFDDKTNVICVFNGPHNLPHSKYNLKKFIENRKKLNERSA